MQENQCVSLYENENQLVNAAIDKIVVEIISKKGTDKGLSVLFFGASPLCGVTSTTINIAIAIANTGRKTLLVDCDVRKSSEFKKSSDMAKFGLADYLLTAEADDELLKKIVYDTNVENLSFVPCGKCTERATRVMCSVKLPILMNAWTKEYDCVVYDLPSIAVVPDAQVMFGGVDGIVLVTALGETRKKQIRDAKRVVSNYRDKYYGMIVNKIEMNEYKKKVREYNYYLSDSKGEQMLGGRTVKKNYRKKAALNAGGNQDAE